MIYHESNNKLFFRILNEKYILVLSILLLGTFLLFFNTLLYDFIENWDDNINVTENSYIKDFSSQGITTLFSKKTPISEPRLTLFSYMIDYQFWKLNPFPYHLANVILHLLNIALVFFLVARLFKRKDMALFAAAIFAVHPMHVESVAWITGRKDLLYSFFFLIALHCYIFYLTKSKFLFKLIILILVYSATYLSLLSKIQALAIPIILLLLDYFYDRKFSVEMIFEKIFLYLIMLQILSIKISIIYGTTLFVIILFNNSDNVFVKYITKTKQKIVFIISALLLLIIFIFLIRNSYILTLLYGLIILAFVLSKTKIYEKISFKKFTTYIIAGIAFLSAVIIFLFYIEMMSIKGSDTTIFSGADRIFMACYALGFYLLKFIAPFNLIAIIPYPEKLAGSLPSQYYISAFFIAIIAFIFLWNIIKNSTYRKVIIFCSLFFLINISLVLHIIPIAGRVVVADRYTYFAYLGLIILVSFFFFELLEKKVKLQKYIITFFILILCVFSTSTWSRNKVWKNGFSLYTDILNKNPEYAMAYTNRGFLYYKKGDIQNAFADYNKAIHADSTFTLSYYNRALAFLHQGKIETAIIDCNTALRINALDKDILYLRGYLKNKQSKYSDAIPDFDKSLQINSKNLFAFYNRGEAKKNIQDYQGAISDFNNAILLAPQFADAYNSRGVAFYQLKKYNESIQDFTQAIYLNPDLNYVYYNKALCEIQMQNTNEACNDLLKAMRLGHAESKTLFENTCK